VRRDLLLGLSLATLWFIGVWSDLLPFLYVSGDYPIAGMPCRNDFGAVVANVTLLGLGFTCAGQLARRGPSWRRTLAGWALLGSLAVPANALRMHFRLPPEYWFGAMGPILGPLAFGVLVLLLLAVAVRWHDRMVRLVIASLTIMFPLVPLTFGQAAWAMSQAGGRLQCGEAPGRAAVLPGHASRRVLWIVYDELDYRTPFETRPSDLDLPVLDRLRAQSLSATAAIAPGDRTGRSMPSYLTGLRVRESMLVGRNELQLKIEGRADLVTWAGRDTIFPKARALGLNTGVSGFFLPYCPILGDTLTTCTWQACATCGRLTGVFGKSVGESMWHQVSELVPRYNRRRHLATFRAVQEGGVALAADPTIGMALIHLGVPHDPVIYDRKRHDYSLRAVEGDGYLHNLALVDRSLGELRDAIEAAGLWDRTTVIVLGDHGRRAPDGMTIDDARVPFLVKLAGQCRGVTYTPRLDLLRVHDLTLEILTGRISTANDVATWLDARR